jgi:hypothetical protein
VRRSLKLEFIILPVLVLGCGSSLRPDGDTSSGGRGGSVASPGTGGTAAAHGEDGGASAHGGAAGSRAGSATQGGSAGGDGGTTAGPTPTGLSSVSLQGAPIYTRAQRLTNSQWEHAVTDILRFGAPANLSADFALPVVGVTDFTNNELVLSVDLRNIGDFETAAEKAAALATDSSDALAALYAGTDAAGLVQALGRRAFRRPLTAAEQTRYEGVFALGEQLYGQGFAHGAALVIRALLQSPHFLYRTELGPSGEPLNGYEIASKLTFWLLDTTPSDAWLDAAAAGELDTDAGIEAAARQMLETRAATQVMRDFHGQLYHLGRLANVSKPTGPDYGADTNAELVEASQRFFDRIFEQQLGLREIFTSTHGFVGPGLAPLYGLATAPSAVEERDLGRSRMGYFLEVPFLLVTGTDEESNPIQRGNALSRDVLCMALVPPIVDSNPLPAPVPEQTTRERVTAFTAGCGSGCHSVYIDPLGFAFESFDGMGRERTTDNGKPVDTSASYPFSDGPQSYEDAQELMEILADNTQAHTCYAKKLASYGLQRDIVASDLPLLEGLAGISQGESLSAMVIALVRDPAFRSRTGVTP